jgi:hypothetical protein
MHPIPSIGFVSGLSSCSAAVTRLHLARCFYRIEHAAHFRQHSSYIRSTHCISIDQNKVMPSTVFSCLGQYQDQEVSPTPRLPALLIFTTIIMVVDPEFRENEKVVMDYGGWCTFHF